MAERLSHAQSLRVIGQNLGVLSLASFKLTTGPDEYIVSSLDLGSEHHSGFFLRLARKLIGRPELEIPTPIRFTASDLLRLDTQRRLQRTPGSPRDRRDLSFMLRVIGDYLDRKNVKQFTIDWSQFSYNVRYDTFEESFTVEDLYNFGIRMYLRRANRFPPDEPAP